jgi:uncharacterized repeat protein (TIGR01451 family)
VVPDNGSVTLLFTVRVLDPAPAGATVIVNAVTPPSGADCDIGEGCDETTPLRNQADLAVIKTGPPQVLPGDQVTFSIVVENRGPDAAANARLEDPTPPGLIFISTSGDCTGPFPCLLGDLASGATRTLTATYLVPDNYAGSSTIVNTVTALSDSDDPTPGDSSSSSSVLVPRPFPFVPVPAVIPVDARWALWALVAAVLGLGAIGLRRID